MTPTRNEIGLRLTCQTAGCAGKPTTDCTILTGPNKGKPRKGLGLHKGRLLAADEAIGIWASRQGEIDTLTALLTEEQADNDTLTAQAAEVAEQLKTARIGAALVPGLQERIIELTSALVAVTAERDERFHQWSEAETDWEEAMDALEAANATIGQLKAQIAALTPKPTDPATIPYWGTPTWRDEFDGTVLDPKVWNVREGYQDAQDHSTMRARNVLLREGRLILRTVRDESSTTRPWSSAYVDTNGKQAFRFGRWEIKAKGLPVGKSAGMWIAWWGRDSIGQGEFDILEAAGTPFKNGYYKPDGRSVSQTAYAVTGKGTKGVDRTESIITQLATPLEQDHVYVLEWTPTRMAGLIDGKVVNEVKAGTAMGDKILAEFPGGLHQRFDTFVGPTSWLDAPDANTAAHEFSIDYVRYWPLPA